MYADTNERPGYEEQYLVATNTSDLTLGEGVDAATHMIAAGLIGNRMGQALVHLRAEWDGLGKIPRWTDEDVRCRAELLPRKGKALDMHRARSELIAAYNRALRERYLRLAGRPFALAVMLDWAQRREVDPDHLSPTLYRWLDPVCPVCSGLGKLRMPDAPSLGKTCFACQGSGERAMTSEGRRIFDWLKGCAAKAKGEGRRMLHGEIDTEALGERKGREAARVRQETDRPEVAAAVAAVAAASMGQRLIGNSQEQGS